MTVRPRAPRILAAHDAGDHARANPACSEEHETNEKSENPVVEMRPCFASSWIEQVKVSSQDQVARYRVSGVDVRIASPSGSSCGIYKLSTLRSTG